MMKNLRNIFIWACLLHNIVLEHSAIFSCGQRGGVVHVLNYQFFMPFLTEGKGSCPHLCVFILMKHHLVFNENCLYGKYVYNSELSHYSELSQIRFSLCRKSRHCVYIIYRVKAWFKIKTCYLILLYLMVSLVR